MGGGGGGGGTPRHPPSCVEGGMHKGGVQLDKTLRRVHGKKRDAGIEDNGRYGSSVVAIFPSNCYV